MKDIECPWFEQGNCKLFRQDVPCIVTTRTRMFSHLRISKETLETNCPRVAKFRDALKRFIERKATTDDPVLLHQSFVSAIPFDFDRLLQFLHVDPKLFRIKIGYWLQEKCREDPACPYKPLLPENF